MRDTIIELLLWCLKKLNYVAPSECAKCTKIQQIPEGYYPIPPATESLVPDALHLAAFFEKTYPHQTGEWKRHHVFNRMLQSHLDSKKSDIALSIEIAHQRMNP